MNVHCSSYTPNTPNFLFGNLGISYACVVHTLYYVGSCVCVPCNSIMNNPGLHICKGHIAHFINDNLELK